MLLGVVLIIIVIAVVAVVFIARWQRRNLRKLFRIEIDNQGNVPSRFELKADDPDAALDFQFLVRGRALPVGTLAGEAEPVQEARPAKTAAPPSVGDVKGKAESAMGISRVIADITGSIGMMLPRSIGAPLIEVSSTLRQGRGRVQQAQNMPGRVTAQSRKVTGALPKGSPASPAAAGASAPSSGVQAQAQAAPVPAAESLPAALLSITPDWAQTPSVEPGESLKLDLVVKPVKPSRTDYYSFGILSKTVGLSGDAEIEEEWSGQITGLAGLRRFHPYLLILALSVFFLLLAFWLASVGVIA